jgi:hypothetical protein
MANLNKHEADQEARLSQIISRLELTIARSLSDIASELDQDVQANRSLVILRFREILRQRGYNTTLAEFDQLFAEELRLIQREFKEIGISEEQMFANLSIDQLDQVMRFQELVLENKLDSLIDDAEGRMFLSLLSGTPLDPSLEEQRVSRALNSSIKTEANTLRAGFARATQFASAKALDLDLFLYIGPDDDITRPFCEDLLSRDPPIYTLDEIDRMDNEQGLDVHEFAGGYNCRHRWRPITQEYARELGWNG